MVRPIAERRLPHYIAAAFIVIAAGLLLRRSSFAPEFLRKYGADALWSLLVFIVVAMLMPRASSKAIAFFAAVFSCAIEVSQLYHAPWIDSIRRTLPGALVLGSTFNWPDFPAYAVGIILALALDRWWLRQPRRR